MANKRKYLSWEPGPNTPHPNKEHVVTQYDLKGNKLHVYKSTREASTVIGNGFTS